MKEQIKGIKATLYKIKGGDNLRTDAMEGEFLAPPKVGRGFKIFGKSLTQAGGMRIIYTSDVKKITKLEEGSGGFILDTVTGSRYGVQLSPDQSS
jgi:hypothetical protein